jgi:hypothetical protein
VDSPTVGKTGSPAVTNHVWGAIKNHVYLVLPTGTIYDDITTRDINQNKIINNLFSEDQSIKIS